MPARIIAACFSLIAFALAIITGLAARNSTLTTLWRAIVAMLVCYIFASVIGSIGEKLIAEHIRQYKIDNPIHPEEIIQTNDQTTDQPEQSEQGNEINGQVQPSEEAA